MNYNAGKKSRLSLSYTDILGTSNYINSLVLFTSVFIHRHYHDKIKSRNGGKCQILIEDDKAFYGPAFNSVIRDM